MPTPKRPRSVSRSTAPEVPEAPAAPRRVPVLNRRRTLAIMVLVLCVAAVILSVAAANRLIDLGRKVTGITTAVTFPSARGSNLHATVTVPDYLSDEEPGNNIQVPLVVLCHGFAANRDANGLFQPLADELAADGIASIRVDFAGCGESEEPFTSYTLQSMSDDIESAIEYMRDLYPIGQIGLVGQDMGGRAVSLHLSDQIAAAALWSPANGNGLNGLEFLNHDPAALEGFRQSAAETGSCQIPDWNVTVSADLLNGMDTSHPCDGIRSYTGALLIAFTGEDASWLSQTTVDETRQAARDRGIDFTDLSDQFASANHNYQSAAGDEAETSALSRSLTEQTAQFLSAALLPGA